MSNETPAPRKTLRLVLAAGAAAALFAAGLTALLVNVFEHKVEAQNPFFKVVDLTDEIDDPAEWGKNFPLHYDGYKRTVDMERTRYGGSEALPHEPTEKDPRKVVSQSKIELDPRLKEIWAGYAFAADFREERGHAYMLEDQIFTERQNVVKQPGTCVNCHASTYVPMMKAGNGDLMKGFEALNSIPYSEVKAKVKHPVACIDCHDPKNMQLRVTRPAFMEGIRKVKALEGVENYDVNAQATRQEMRSFVCGQCHVEYYFKGPEKRLTFPWDKGRKGDEILAYYEEIGFKDWQHKKSGAPALKAQHPEFELWSQGIHAKSGVSCADCHMPYKRTGAMKISDHHIRSPLLNVAGACQTCHRFPEKELEARVLTIQTRHTEMRDRAMDAVVELIHGLEAARAAGTPDASLAPAQGFQRKAQFLLDFVEAENSTGFHAPQEAARLLTQSVDYARKGQLALLDVTRPAPATAAIVPAVAPAPPATK